jgi:capsular exopolysaccharide synthesis family protein
MDRRGYLRVLRRRKVTVAAAMLICVTVALGLSLAAEPTYQAEAKLLVVAKSRPGGGVSSAYEGALLSQQLIASFSEMLQSRAILQRALELDPQPLTANQLQAQVNAQPILDTLLIRLTVHDHTPRRAQRLANSVARAFIQELPRLQGGSTIQVDLVETALLPSTPVAPRLKVNVTLGLLLGTLLGLGLAFLREHMDTSIKTPEMLEAAGHVPVVGAIPIFKASKEPVPVSNRPRSVEAEAFRKLRTNFTFLGVDKESICCLITSPMAGEGKSTVAANLAIALAQAGQRVAVVEADLRKPAVHEVLDLEQRVGVTTVLMGRTEVDDALQPFRTESLVALTSGQLPPNPSELLGSRQMAELLAQLRRRADVVLLDCPPLLPVTDPMVVASHTDGVLLVVRAGKTTTDQVQAARATCDKAGAHVFGAVLNATNVAEGDQPTYYGHYGERRASVELAPPPSRSDRTRAARRGRRRSA